MRASKPQIRYPSRPFGPSPLRPRAPSGALVPIGLFALALLAGCTAGNGGGNLAPHADLTVNKDNGYTTDDFVFDASGSKDPDGRITNYRFDFGDGTPPIDKSNDNMTQVTHKFPRGGQFTITLTVTDDGKDSAGSLTGNDATSVVVNQRVPITTMAVNALPTGGNQTSKASQPFQVYEKANRFELNTTVTGLLATGSSEITVRVLDPDGNTVAEKSAAIQQTGQQTVELDGLLTKQGAHKVEVEAKSGGATLRGELRVIYGEKLPG